MEIANTKQQKDPSLDTADTSSKIEMKLPTLPCTEEDEINALYESVPEVANHFTITDKIGEGAFSCVYLARLKHYPEVTELFALKHILPTTHPARIENKLRCLLKLGGQENVMGVKLCLRNRDNVVIVMEFFPHEKFSESLGQMSVEEARDYMRNMLVALRRVHQFKVIHRDIKPSNFLCNRQNKRYSLVDFGLASGSFLIDRDGEKMGKKSQPASTAKKSISPVTGGSRVPLSPSKANISHSKRASLCLGQPGTSVGPPGPMKKSASFCLLSSSSKAFLERSGLCSCLGKPQICSLCVARKNQLAPRAGTSGFRAPEVLLKSSAQDTAVDIWSAGTVFLSILSGRYPFFRAQDDIGFLSQIISVLGSAACVEAAKSFGKVLTLSEDIPPLDLRSTCLKLRSTQMAACLGTSSSSNNNNGSSQVSELINAWANLSPHAFDLLARMLDPNPSTRITAEEALKHPFFTEEDASLS